MKNLEIKTIQELKKLGFKKVNVGQKIMIKKEIVYIHHEDNMYRKAFKFEVYI